MAIQRASRRSINEPSQKGRKSTQRERLLSGMVTAANRRGYAGASVSEVIAQAGVSRPTFYDYFADRDECFTAAITDTQSQLLSAVRDAAQGRPPEDAVAAAIEAMVAFAVAEPAKARFLMKESLAGGTPALDARDRGIAEIALLVEGAFARVAPEQAIPDLPLDMAIGAAQRLLASRLRRGERAHNAMLEDLLAWIRSYARPAGEHRWRTLAPVGTIAPSPFLPSTPMSPPLPLPPGRPRLSEEAVAENHRQRIMFATAKVVAERGYSTATIAEITRLAGVDGRAFYRLFADKQDAFSAIYEHGFQHTMATVASAYFAGRSWPERIWEAMRAATQSAQGSPTAVDVGLIEAYSVGAGAIQRVEDSRAAFTIYLQEGYRCEQLQFEPSRLALEAIMTSIFEILYSQARERASRDTANLLPNVVHLCLVPFLGFEQTNRFIDEQLEDDHQRPARAGTVTQKRAPVAHTRRRQTARTA
jgi:AcrR family transcriptional regulator